VRRQITLEAIAEGTKVPARHLRALEQDKFEQLPGGVFNKGIVRSYCRAVGLDEQVWLERFPSVAPPEPTPDWVAFAENVRRNREAVSGRLGAKWVGAMLMVAILAAVCWLAWTYMLRPRLSEAPVGAVNPAAADVSASAAKDGPR
jgi:cytoskeletal protein RodZ